MKSPSEKHTNNGQTMTKTFPLGSCDYVSSTTNPHAIVSMKIISNTICNALKYKQLRSTLHIEWTIHYHQPTYTSVLAPHKRYHDLNIMRIFKSLPNLMCHLQVFDWLKDLSVENPIDHIESLNIQLQVLLSWGGILPTQWMAPPELPKYTGS
jgi:hypothetical protein